MDYQLLNTGRSALLDTLKAHFNIKENQNLDLETLADETLKAVRGGFPDIYFFSDVDGQAYIVSNEMVGFFDAFIVKVDNYNSDNNYTVCQNFVLCEYQNTDDYMTEAEDGTMVALNYYEVLAAYGIKDILFVDCADDDSAAVHIWAQHHWHEDHRDMPADSYISDWFNEDAWGEPKLNDAKDRIAELNAQPYELRPFEIERPTYFVIH